MFIKNNYFLVTKIEIFKYKFANANLLWVK